jgi:hypothetical protein
VADAFSGDFSGSGLLLSVNCYGLSLPLNDLGGIKKGGASGSDNIN